MTTDRASVRCRDDGRCVARRVAVISQMQSGPTRARAAQRDARADPPLQHPLPALLQLRPRRRPRRNDRLRDTPELSLPEILTLVAELREAGCLFLTLTGGEILSYPHLFAVLDRARELNFAVQLLTNGTLLRPGMAARLAGYRNILGNLDDGEFTLGKIDSAHLPG